MAYIRDAMPYEIGKKFFREAKNVVNSGIFATIEDMNA
jgi:hypothetical protein